METRARYVLVGVFTLLSFLAALGFTLWLAKVQVDRAYTQYDIVFDTVAGLGQASAVRYNGVTVGKVVSIALDREDAARVRVRIEVDATTPIREATIATLATQGVTGVAFVALEGGSADSPRLRVEPPAEVAVIASKPSVLQDLLTEAPDLLAEANSLMRDFRAFATPENRAAIAEILRNVESATARIDNVAMRTEAILMRAEGTLSQADAALLAAQGAFASADDLIASDLPAILRGLEAAVSSFGRAASGFDDFTRSGLPQFSSFATEARSLVANINALTSRISSDPGRFLLGNQTPEYRR